jgi:hypothetical protein
MVLATAGVRRVKNARSTRNSVNVSDPERIISAWQAVYSRCTASSGKTGADSRSRCLAPICCVAALRVIAMCTVRWE